MVSDLITPAILGLDFLQLHGLVLDFSSEVIKVYPKRKHTDVEHQQLRHMMEEAHNKKRHTGVIAAINADSSEISEECAIPDLELPKPINYQKIVGINSDN